MLLWKCFGPKPGGHEMQPEFFRLLGMETPPERGEYFLDLPQFVLKHDKPAGSLDSDQIKLRQSRVRSRPWSAQEFPELAAWLKAIEKPLAVAVDLMLSTAEDPEVDKQLAASFMQCPSVILGVDIVRKESIWEEPIGLFRKPAAALGHVHADPDPVSRRIPLEKAVAGKRYWALALEAFRLSKQAGSILETPEDLEVGSTRVPASRQTARSVYVNYAPSTIPQVSLKEVRRRDDAAMLFSGKVVFCMSCDSNELAQASLDAGAIGFVGFDKIPFNRFNDAEEPIGSHVLVKHCQEKLIAPAITAALERFLTGRATLDEAVDYLRLWITKNAVAYVREYTSVKERREVAALFLKVKDGLRYHGPLGIRFAIKA